MRSTLITIFAVALLVISLGMQQSGQATLPQGHPPVAMPDQPAPAPEADPADVESIESIITAYYDVISGEAGQPRNWDRFHSLFAPEARRILRPNPILSIGLILAFLLFGYFCVFQIPQELQKLYFKIARAEVPKYASWCRPVYS